MYQNCHLLRSFVRTVEFHQAKKMFSYVLVFSKMRSELKQFCVRTIILIVCLYYYFEQKILTTKRSNSERENPTVTLTPEIS